MVLLDHLFVSSGCSEYNAALVPCVFCLLFPRDGGLAEAFLFSAQVQLRRGLAAGCHRGRSESVLGGVCTEPAVPAEEPALPGRPMDGIAHRFQTIMAGAVETAVVDFVPGGAVPVHSGDPSGGRHSPLTVHSTAQTPSGYWFVPQTTP